MIEGKNKKVKLVLLVGEGHSGSTLVDLILDSHSKISGVSEVSHYLRVRDHNIPCSCKKPIKNCLFWEGVSFGVNLNDLPLVGRKIKDFLLNKNNFVYFKDEQFKPLDVKKYIFETEKMYKNILNISNKGVIFDSSKSPDRAEILINSNKFDIVLLHFVRDGRGVTYSNIKIGRKPFFYMKRWFTVNLKTEIVKLRNRNVKNIFVLYEDFANQPEKIIEYMVSEFGLIFEPEMMRFRNKVHHQSGGNYNLIFKNDSERIVLDEVWRKKMFLKNKMVFNLFFGWFNLFYKIKPKKYRI